MLYRAEIDRLPDDTWCKSELRVERGGTTEASSRSCVARTTCIKTAQIWSVSIDAHPNGGRCIIYCRSWPTMVIFKVSWAFSSLTSTLLPKSC